MANLATYLEELSDICRDPLRQFTSTAQMTRYINDARRQVAIRSACLSALVTGQSAFGTSAQPGYIIPGAMIPGSLPYANPNNQNEAGANSTASNTLTTIPGCELYPYSYFSTYLRQQFSGYKDVIYIFNLSVSWGSNRPTLDFVPWDDLQALMRAWNVGVNSFPSVWSCKGVGENGQAWLFPCPSTIFPGEMEAEVVCTPMPLYTNDDPEALPELFQNAVKYFAAYRLFLAQQRTGMAETMRGLFDEQIGTDAVASDWGHISSHYQTWP